MKITNVRTLYPYVNKGLLIGYGRTAFCYRLPDNRVLKLYVETYSKQDYFNKYNDMLEHLDLLHIISNDSFIGPDEVLMRDNKVVGYIYPYIDGTTIKTMRNKTRLSDLYCNFNKLIEDTVKVGNHQFMLIDVHNENILFDGSRYYVIDLDQGKLSVDDTNPIQRSITQNVREVATTITNTYFRGDNGYILQFRDLNIDEIYRNINWQDDKQVYDFFRALSERCHSANPTLGEVRRKVKVKLDFNDYRRPF